MIGAPAAGCGSDTLDASKAEQGIESSSLFDPDHRDHVRILPWRRQEGKGQGIHV